MLHHYKARVYDPVLGRFLQTDPIGYEDDQNLYAYVYNDPLNKADPTGKEAACITLNNCGTAIRTDADAKTAAVALVGVAAIVSAPVLVAVAPATVTAIGRQVAADGTAAATTARGTSEIGKAVMKQGERAVSAAKDTGRQMAQNFKNDKAEVLKTAVESSLDDGAQAAARAANVKDLARAEQLSEAGKIQGLAEEALKGASSSAREAWASIQKLLSGM